MLQMLGTGPSMTKERFEDVAGRLVCEGKKLKFA
jgi:hypothetical protein